MDCNSDTAGSLSSDAARYPDPHSDPSSSLGSEGSDIRDDSAADSSAPSSLRSDEHNLHNDNLDDDPNTQYPPPSYIDFRSGDLRPPFPPTRPSALSFHCQWLGGTHDEYPLATTLDKYVELQQTGSSFGTLEYAALVQRKLTFGLLEAILRIKIPESFLLAQAADGTTTLSTANVITLCRDLYHRLRVRHHPAKCQSWLKDGYETLVEASRSLESYHRNWRTNPFLAAGLHEEASEDMIRALSMIGMSLNDALIQSSSECNPSHTIPQLNYHDLANRKPAEAQLRAQGWCPLSIAALGTYGFLILEYARSFNAFLRHTGEHDGCTEATCTVNNIDPETYTQKHFPDDCACAPIIPPVHIVKSRLAEGCIPVVTLCEEALSVWPAKDVPYVAISHVWIDGLGSTTEEGLPACQLSRIASLTASLVPGGAFWIDGLCVPNQKDLRKKAIQLMAQTYTDAAAVLVIDAGIRSCSKDAPLEEKLLRIATSGWMQRLWTYQEGMLAKKLFFEFADGLVNVEDLIPSLEERCSSLLLLHLMFTLFNVWTYISAGKREKDSLKIGQVAYGVQWRTTSRIGDETLAIAGLLQIDIRELLNASSPDERMKSLLLQNRTVSPFVIFHTAPKISGIPGFSWAPRSFMTGSHPGSWVGEESAICTPRGLLAEYASLVFSESVGLDEDSWYVIRDRARPAWSFLLRQMVLSRDASWEFCNAILIERDITTLVGSFWECVGVRMVDVEEGTYPEREQVCQYQELHFRLEVIDVSWRQATDIRVIDATWIPRMKVRVV